MRSNPARVVLAHISLEVHGFDPCKSSRGRVRSRRGKVYAPSRFFFFVGAALLPVAAVRSQTPFLDPMYAVQTTDDVQYGTGTVGVDMSNAGFPGTGSANGAYQEALTADIYQPVGANLPSQLPAVILMHQGGFTTGDKSDSDVVSVAESLASMGYVVMDMNYRLITQGIPDETATMSSAFNPVAVYNNQAFQYARGEGLAAAINDSKEATQWLLQNASNYDIDTNKLLIGGISSGARVALADGLLEMPGVFSGVISLLGGLDNNESLITPTSPPPTLANFMYNATQDTLVDPVQAQELANATTAAGIPTDFQLVNSGHDISLLMQPDASGVSPWSNGMSFIYNELSLGSLAQSSNVVPEASVLTMFGIMGAGLASRFAYKKYQRRFQRS